MGQWDKHAEIVVSEPSTGKVIRRLSGTTHQHGAVLKISEKPDGTEILFSTNSFKIAASEGQL